MARIKPVVGIDFGTSNTSAAWVDAAGKIKPVHITPVDTSMPTVVWYPTKDKFVVGEGARQKIVDDPRNTVFGFKRLLGRPLKSEFVTRIRDRFPFQLVEGDDGNTAVELHGEVKSLQSIAAAVIHRIAELASVEARVELEECVLAVPSHYGWRQRQVIRGAAELAGLRVRALVNEPTAAALFFAKHSAGPGVTLVFDLGGGTFDATLIAIQGYTVKVLGSGGDAFLGGADFDEKIAEALARRFEIDNGVDLRAQHVVMQRLAFAAEMAKIQLSVQDSANVRVMFATEKNGRPLDLDYPVNRALLETLVAPLIERCVGVCDELLTRAGVKSAEVGELVLVGGQTRMPAIRRRLYGLYKGDPNKTLNPELGVSSGAAVLGRMLNLPAGPALVDVVSVPIWLMVPGLPPRPAIAANTALPSVGRVPIDAPTGPGPLTMLLYEALDAASVDREILGSVKLEPGWLAAHPGALQLEVTMTASFTVKVAARAADGTREKLELMAPKPRKS